MRSIFGKILSKTVLVWAVSLLFISDAEANSRAKNERVNSSLESNFVLDIDRQKI